MIYRNLNKARVRTVSSVVINVPLATDGVSTSLSHWVLLLSSHAAFDNHVRLLLLSGHAAILFIVRAPIILVSSHLAALHGLSVASVTIV